MIHRVIIYDVVADHGMACERNPKTVRCRLGTEPLPWMWHRQSPGFQRECFQDAQQVRRRGTPFRIFPQSRIHESSKFLHRRDRQPLLFDHGADRLAIPEPEPGANV